MFQKQYNRNTEQVNYGEGNNKIGNKQIFLSELLNNLEPYKENMLYEDIADTEGEIVSEIFDFLLDKQEITTQDLLKIFADCNSYVVGFEDKNISKYLEENISQMVRVINVSYKISKSNFIWRKKDFRLRAKRRSDRLHLSGCTGEGRFRAEEKRRCSCCESHYFRDSPWTYP